MVLQKQTNTEGDLMAARMLVMFLLTALSLGIFFFISRNVGSVIGAMVVLGWGGLIYDIFHDMRTRQDKKYPEVL